MLDITRKELPSRRLKEFLPITKRKDCAIEKWVCDKKREKSEARIFNELSAGKMVRTPNSQGHQIQNNTRTSQTGKNDYKSDKIKS